MNRQPPVPHARILELLATAERDVGDYFGSLDAEEFVRRDGDAWTPAQHLDHLNIATSAAAKAYAVPSWLLRLRFGRARRASRGYDELRSDYRALLAQGGRATGRYVPAPDATTTEEALVRRTMLLSRWYRVNARLQDGIRETTESALERARVPHPLLGRLTLRELALWTAYHGHHHVEAVQRRLGGSDG